MDRRRPPSPPPEPPTAPAPGATSLSVTPALEVLRVLLHVSHGIERVSKTMEGEIGVTAQQRMVMRVVGRHPGITPGHLAEHLHVDPSTISAILRRLEAKGLLRRMGDPRDGRRTSLGLTEAGRALDKPETGTVEAVVAELLARESSARARDAQLFLTRLAEMLEAEAARPRPRRP